MTPFEEALTSGVTSGLAIVIIVGIVRYLDNRVKRHRQVQNIRDRLLYHFGRIRHAEAVETSPSEPSPEITEDMVRYMLFQEMRRELGVLTTYRSTALTHSERADLEQVVTDCEMMMMELSLQERKVIHIFIAMPIYQKLAEKKWLGLPEEPPPPIQVSIRTSN